MAKTHLAKTYLFENRGLAGDAVKKFAFDIDANYVEINTEPGNDWDIPQDFMTICLMTLPSLENIVTSSAFETIMPLRAHKIMVPDRDEQEWDLETAYKQIEHFAYLLFHALRIRQKFGCKSLTVHINYYNVDFLKDLKSGKLGEETLNYVKLILRQQDNICFKIYEDFKLKYTLTEEDHLL